MEIQLYDGGATNECCDGLATRRYKSKRGSLFRYWAQRERISGREEEVSELESRGEKKGSN